MLLWLHLNKNNSLVVNDCEEEAHVLSYVLKGPFTKKNISDENDW